MAMARIASNQLGICPWSMRVRPIPKVSIIVEVTTKSVREKAKKIAKNGCDCDVFYQCLWITKLCAKFGRSRIHINFHMTVEHSVIFDF